MTHHPDLASLQRDLAADPANPCLEREVSKAEARAGVRRSARLTWLVEEDPDGDRAMPVHAEHPRLDQSDGAIFHACETGVSILGRFWLGSPELVNCNDCRRALGLDARSEEGS